MKQKTVRVFLVAILLSFSLTAFVSNNTNGVYAQALTTEQQELLDQSMEEAQILQEQAMREAQEKAEEERVKDNFALIAEGFKRIWGEVKEEFEDEFEEAFENMPIMADPELDISPSLGGLLGGALLTTSAVMFFVIFIILIALGGLILNIIMLIDCSNREFNDKSLWMAVLIAGMLMGWGIIPGVLYYFLVKKKLGPIVKKEESK